MRPAPPVAYLMACLMACLLLPGMLSAQSPASTPESTPESTPDSTPDSTPASTPAEPPAGTSEATDAAPESSAPLARVIVYPSRLRAVAGHVLSSTSDKLVVKGLDGRTHEFNPTLIFGLVQLHELDSPVPAVVLLADGRRREGILEEDAFEYIKMRIHDVPHRFDRTLIVSLHLLPDVLDVYALRLKHLDEDDPADHLRLAQWLWDEDQHDLAEAELERLLQRHNLELARRLLRRVRARRSLDAASASTGTSSTGKTPRERPELVSRDDVNLVRVYEIDLKDPPRLRISPKTVQSLIESYGDSTLIPPDERSRAMLIGADPVKIVEIMFALRAREFYGDVKVLTEPRVLEQFRRSIHDTWLTNRCGSRACHGGTENTGRFRLHFSPRPDDRIRTSNLLVLNRLDLDGQRLLNRVTPEDSLLYQYALPRDEATHPHPDVPNWTPVLTPGAAKAREACEAWITAITASHHRDWPVTYTPWTPTPPAASPQPTGPDAQATPDDSGRQTPTGDR